MDLPAVPRARPAWWLTPSPPPRWGRKRPAACGGGRRIIRA